MNVISHDVSETIPPARDRQKRKISGVARPRVRCASLRVCGRDTRSLCRFVFCFVMGKTPISLGFPIHSRIFLANSFGLNLDESCIFFRSNLSLSALALGHRTSVLPRCSLCTPDRPPPFCLITFRRSRTDLTFKSYLAEPFPLKLTSMYIIMFIIYNL